MQRLISLKVMSAFMEWNLCFITEISLGMKILLA